MKVMITKMAGAVAEPKALGWAFWALAVLMTSW